MRGLRISSTVRRLVLTALLALCASALPAAGALATGQPAAGWEVNPGLFPSHLAPGTSGYIMLAVYNVGGAGSSGKVTVTDRLPAGLTATEAGYYSQPFLGAEEEFGLEEGEQWECNVGAVVTCTSDQSYLASIPPGEMEWLAIAVKAAPDASGSEVNQVTVSGGGAPVPASASQTIAFGTTPAPFGFERLDGWFTNADGTLDTQAGSHPYMLTASFFLNNEVKHEEDVPVSEARDITFNLPRGLVGDPAALPECTSAELNSERCPADTQVGVDRVSLGGPNALRFPEGGRPPIEAFGQDFIVAAQFSVFNMVPPPGVPAQFAFSLAGAGTWLNSAVRSGGDYGISEHIDNIPQRAIIFNTTTIWGTPGDTSHDLQRCADVLSLAETHCNLSPGVPPKPLLTLPTACEGPQKFSATVEAWPSEGVQAPDDEASFPSHDSSGTPVGFTGCDHLDFAPKVQAAPDTGEAETPAGLTVEVQTPQEGLANVDGLATSNIKNTTVTLPEGMAINPGQAAGLAACQSYEDGVGTEAMPSCPNASKVGTDEIQTPLLSRPLSGNVYVLQSNPPDLKLLVAASGEGVNLKLVGDVRLDERTGRLTTTFSETPELPFTLFKLSFSGGARAALTTPPRCGAYGTTSDFTPWSSPDVPDAFPASEFVLTSGPAGSACAWPRPFDPSLTAGSTTDQAGGYTDFSMQLSRGDGQQQISGLQFKTPEGLLGMISKVPLCGEPQAAQGTCPAASQIGHTVVEAGPGPYPLVVPQPGQPPAPIYLTGGYEGAPYGLSIVVPLVVGPFTLQTQVVRARIEVDPHTAQLTITTDPLPTIIDGVPADLRTIDAEIDRPEFMFNPTNCAPQAFTGTATSTEGAQAPLSSHFQMGSCRTLAFKPDFKASTQGRTSRANGASLAVKLVYPTGALGANQASSQSNIARVKVELPKRLPSRLSTLQKACPAQVFEANPAGCPAASMVGHATAITPVLPVPLTGPAYFVSHGGEAFPSLIVVLQGYGVTVDLVGTTFISNKGITSSTFKQVPDVPIGSFELTLPQGPYSALAANGNLCRGSLEMPTEFVAQDGAVIRQKTRIAPTGCPKAKHVRHKRGGSAKARGRRRRSSRGKR